jgi:hypothetical protein
VTKFAVGFGNGASLPPAGLQSSPCHSSRWRMLRRRGCGQRAALSIKSTAGCGEEFMEAKARLGWIRLYQRRLFSASGVMERITSSGRR